MFYDEIRQQIISGKLEIVFQTLNTVTETDYKNDIQLLWFQYNDWNKRKNLDLGAESVEINRIIYSLLNLITSFEQKENINKVNQAMLIKFNEHESKLKEGYEKLSKLHKKGLLDLFINWLQDNYPQLFERIINAEKSGNDLMDIKQILNKVDLFKFIKSYNLNLSTESLYQSIVLKAQNDNNFFITWIEYKDFKQQTGSKLLISIKSIEKHYKGILEKAGYLLTGAGIMWGVTELAESDIDDDNDDGDDDDDDD